MVFAYCEGVYRENEMLSFMAIKRENQQVK